MLIPQSFSNLDPAQQNTFCGNAVFNRKQRICYFSLFRIHQSTHEEYRACFFMANNEKERVIGLEYLGFRFCH